MVKNCRVWVEKELLEKVKSEFSETEGLTYSGVVDWALRFLLKLKRESKV